MSTPSPLWYATRGLGMVLLLVVTAVVVLGVMTSRRWTAEGWPRFLTSELHRNLSLLALALLPLHGLAVVLDTYAHLGLWDITVPFGSRYRPFWLGLGVLAGELLVALVATSLVRVLLGHRLWRLTHWAVYAVWPLALLHGLGTGSDTRAGWALLTYVASVVAVLLAVLIRLALHRPGVTGGRLAAGLAVTAGVLGVAIFTMLGPLRPGWAAAAGTPPELLGGRGAAATPAAQATPAATATVANPAAPLPAGLDDALLVQVRQSESGQRLTFTDQRDPSLQLSVVIAGRQATSGPFEVRSQGRLVCQTQATFAQEITAVCGGTALTIALVRQGDQLAGELTTDRAP